MSSTAVRVSAALAAVVVIALFGSLFYIHGIHTDTFKSGPASTITTGATPGSAAYYVPSAVTARGIDKHYSPVGTTAHFRVGDTVYVVVRVANVAQGTSNTLAIAWYLDGHLLSPVGRLEQRIPPQTTSPFNAYFSLPFNQSGVGMAKIYWNAPASDPGTSASDPALAQTLTFTVAN